MNAEGHEPSPVSADELRKAQAPSPPHSQRLLNIRVHPRLSVVPRGVSRVAYRVLRMAYLSVRVSCLFVSIFEVFVVMFVLRIVYGVVRITSCDSWIPASAGMTLSVSEMSLSAFICVHRRFRFAAPPPWRGQAPLVARDLWRVDG